MGLAVGIGTGVSELVLDLEKEGFERKRSKDLERLTERALKESKFWTDFIEAYSNAMTDTEVFINSEKGRKMADIIGEAVSRGLWQTKKGFTLFRVAKNIKTFYHVQKLVRPENAGLIFKKWPIPRNTVINSKQAWNRQVVSGQIRRLGKKIGKTIGKVTPNRVLSKIKISRARVEKLKHLTRAGGKLARTIAGVGSAVEVFSGIKNVIRGAKQLGSGSALANEFRKVSAELKRVKIDINNYVKLL